VGLEKLPIPPKRGGAIEKGIVEVSRRHAKNHSVSILALGGGGYPSYESVSGVEYYREGSIPLANSTLGKYLFYKNLLKHLRKIDPDIIHIHIRPTLTYLTRLYSDAPNVVSIHSYFDGFRMTKYPFSMIEDRLIHLGFKNCSAIMPCSNHVGLWLKRRLGVEERKIRVVHGGVDTAKFRYDERLAEHVMEKHGLRRKKVLVYVGRIIPEKGVHILLSAFQIVRKSFPQAVLFIIGPPGEFGTLKSSCYASKLMEASTNQKVYFLGELDEIIPYLCACDVFVYPPIWEEPFGIAVIEAMACERPVVASRVGGISEIIDSERTGILTAPNDAFALANAVIRLFEEPDRAQRMGRQARREVQRRFTWDRAAENYLKVYKEVIRSMPCLGE